jgi:hypothetical protein
VTALLKFSLGWLQNPGRVSEKDSVAWENIIASTKNKRLVVYQP